MGSTLHQVGFQPEPGFAGTRAANDKDILISGGFGVGRAVVHGQALRLGEDDVVFKHRVSKRLNILCCAPPGGAVFHVLAELLGVLSLHIDTQPYGCGDGNADAEIYRVEAWQRGGKGGGQSLHEVQELPGEIRAGGQPRCLPQLGGKQSDGCIWDVGQKDFLPVHLFQRSSSFFFVRSTTAD